MKNLLITGILLCAALSGYTQQRQAPPFVTPFRITGGFFLPFNTTDVQLSETELLGTEVNLENDLGFSEHINTFVANAQWRAGARSRFDFSYYRFHRSARHQLQKTIRFGENTYDVQANTDAYFNTDIFRLSYGYAIFQGAQYEVGLKAGVHVIKTEMGIALTGVGQEYDLKDDFDVTAPLPDVGIWGGYAITPRLSLQGEASYMSLTVDDVHGDILTGGVHVNYNIVKGLDAALGYTGSRIRMEGERDGLIGDVDWRYHGPSLSVSWTFGNKRW
ncbi:hypothetical protein [Chitinophaga sp.]|mgnify:CR=1 FL=1|uniref:hypothetical protein n=1 Tax=Chitinophaga sp. TaxID=1869181 RepID=UPI00260A41D8|nr:hypothetical protein [uncultured Chitinophaga sp.]